MQYLIILLLLFLNSCSLFSNSTKSGDVGVSREQLLLVSSTEMQSTATNQYKDILKKAFKNKTLNTDKKILKRVRVIAKNLITQVGVFRSDALKWQWEVNITKSKKLNAWCMPGGKIMVYTGIVDRLKLTDDEIAAIMGHEISHALREHGREREHHSN